MTGCFSLPWGHSREALAARRTGCCLLHQVLAQQAAPVLPRDPYKQSLGETQCTRGRASFPPACPGSGGAALLAGLTRPLPSQSGWRANLHLDLPCRWGRSHAWPVSRSSPIYPGSQVPMVTPLSCGDDHRPRQTLVPGPGMHSTHNLSEIDFPGL